MRYLLFFIIFFVGCEQANPPEIAPEDTPEMIGSIDKIEIKVMASGTILADGQTVTLEQLSDELLVLKENKGTVWYYREAATSEPHPNAMEVIKLVVENQLPITMSTKPDYSDVVGPSEKPHTHQ